MFTKIKKPLVYLLITLLSLPVSILMGTAKPALAATTLAAEDFGVVNYDTGLGTLKGYTSGFNLTGASFGDATSIIVKLYAAGNQLLQTNTATFKVGTLTGTQFSSPFDVSGTFDYTTDGYWDNDHAISGEYGQNVPAAKVVAIITLANDEVVTATNENLSGDPTTIYPLGTLSAEDFGVVNYDVGGGLGVLRGYTAGFGLADATFAGTPSVVVSLYAAGDQLLQTNTAILPKFNVDVTGTQFSSPFDVSGSFNYATDGYWTNLREAEYGQTVAATKVVATVVLANGKIVTATNLNPTGDLTKPSIPVATPAAGNFSTAQNVTLASSDNLTTALNIKIYYTLDGSCPDNLSTLYAGSITVDHGLTLSAVAYDEAGNTSDVMTAKYTFALASPDITVISSNKTISVSWNAIAGAAGYYVYVGTSSGSSYVYKSTELSAATTTFSQTEGNYGTFYVRVTTVNSSGIESTDSVAKQKSVTLIAPVTTPITTTVTTARVLLATTSVIPAPAPVATTAPSSSVTTPSDDQGQIKGEDDAATSTNEEEKVNWTPWIILFILIILAGAATGGYFYWFAGDEDEKDEKAKGDQKVTTGGKPKNTTKPDNSKKNKRW